MESAIDDAILGAFFKFGRCLHDLRNCCMIYDAAQRENVPLMSRGQYFCSLVPIPASMCITKVCESATFSTEVEASVNRMKWACIAFGSRLAWKFHPPRTLVRVKCTSKLVPSVVIAFCNDLQQVAFNNYLRSTRISRWIQNSIYIPALQWAVSWMVRMNIELIPADQLSCVSLLSSEGLRMMSRINSQRRCS